MTVREWLRPVRSRLHYWQAEIRICRAARRSPLMVSIGAEDICQPGWISTERENLNILRGADWRKFFRPASIDAIMAEHVWEHLALPEASQAAMHCLNYLKPGGYLRVAVPDGFHPSPEYIAAVRPGGTGGGAQDHKVLYTHESIGRLFANAGFCVKLLEYFDAAGSFHCVGWNPEAGLIRRSSRFDKRNAAGEMKYTSLILDAFKPVAGGTG